MYLILKEQLKLIVFDEIKTKAVLTDCIFFCILWNEASDETMLGAGDETILLFARWLVTPLAESFSLGHHDK